MNRTIRRSIVLLGMNLGVGLGLLSSAPAQPALDQLENETGKQARTTPKVDAQSPADEPGYLGLIADDRQEQGRGVRVLEVVAGGPAERAGIEVGDLIVGLGDRKVSRMDELADAAGRSPPGTKVPVSLERGGKPRQIEITLANRPKRQEGTAGPLPHGDARTGEPILPPRRRLLGIRTVAVTEEIRQLYDLPQSQGALVSEVLVSSPAHQAGVPLDAVIVEANAKPIASPEDLARAVAQVGPGKEIELGYYSRGQFARKKIRLDDDVDGQQIVNRPPRPAPPDAEEQISADLDRFEHLENRVRELEGQVSKLVQLLQQATRSSEKPPPSDENP